MLCLYEGRLRYTVYVDAGTVVWKTRMAEDTRYGMNGWPNVIRGIKEQVCSR